MKKITKKLLNYCGLFNIFFFKFEEIIENKLFRDIWTSAFQLYRVAMKFFISERGFESLTKLVDIILTKVNIKLN